jgi:hypothetical protein
VGRSSPCSARRLPPTAINEISRTQVTVYLELEDSGNSKFSYGVRKIALETCEFNKTTLVWPNDV